MVGDRSDRGQWESQDRCRPWSWRPREAVASRELRRVGRPIVRADVRLCDWITSGLAIGRGNCSRIGRLEQPMREGFAPSIDGSDFIGRFGNLSWQFCNASCRRFREALCSHPHQAARPQEPRGIVGSRRRALPLFPRDDEQHVRVADVESQARLLLGCLR